MDSEPNRVLVLCTGNSCRSQMAEGLINHLLSDQWVASSAGTAPSGYVHPLAVKAMGELGIDIADGLSKSVEQFQGVDFDVVITVCDDAAENCPVWLGEGERTHIGFDDPADAIGTEEEQMKIYRRVRDEVREQLLPYLTEWSSIHA